MAVLKSRLTAGLPAAAVEPAGTPGGERRYRSGSLFEELARRWFKQRGMHRAITPLWLPGKTASGLRQGGNIRPPQACGLLSWETWLQQRLSRWDC